MERFILQKGSGVHNWLCTDKENGIVCEFQEHQFNDTQRVVPLEDNILNNNPLALAKAMREMADWLRENHYDKVF
ncbi:MAG: hypothetical protein IKO33_02675 [Bacteroidaceae bacterium]|jgi:hypothetical protein|nr:hypothetical protein [Bacteroidaceae bacterium]